MARIVHTYPQPKRRSLSTPDLLELSEEAEAATSDSLCKLAAAGDVLKLGHELTTLGQGPFASYLNRPGSNLRTPLHVAAAAGHLAMVSFLLTHGAAVNPLDHEERTPLDLAERAGHEEVAAALRAKGGFVAQQQRLEQSAQLIHAAARGDLDAVTAQIGKGADPTGMDYDQRTPLHLAASEGRMRVASYLVHLGVPLSPIDRFGGTPLKYAQQYGHWELARFLERRGAKLATADTKPPVRPLLRIACEPPRDPTCYSGTPRSCMSHACAPRMRGRRHMHNLAIF